MHWTSLYPGANYDQEPANAWRMKGSDAIPAEVARLKIDLATLWLLTP